MTVRGGIMPVATGEGHDVCDDGKERGMMFVKTERKGA